MRATVVLFLSAAAILAQPRAGTPAYPGGAPGPKSPLPSIIHPGTPTQVKPVMMAAAQGRPPGGGGGGIGRPPGGGGGIGRPPGVGVGRPPVNGVGRPGYGPRRTTVPLVVPYYGGYGYGSGYPSENGSGYAPQDPYAQPPINDQPSTSGVYLNRDYQPERINPQTRDYSNTPLPEAVPQELPPMRVLDAPVYINDRRDPDEPTVYLLALKDQSVIPAIAYWVEGDTLRYVTRQHALNTISLDLVDRPFSRKLNRERNVEFSLPADQQ